MIPARPRKQPMAELKLRRLLEHNQRLRDDLARPRIKVSEASATLKAYCSSTPDPILRGAFGETKKGQDPYAPVEKGCCSLM
ncbi:Guanine nucleotide-binding protein subunit gamma [Cryptotrichosporon argae]